MPHTIRLREPWTQTPAVGDGVRWSRRFNRPTGLSSGDVVMLEIDGLPPDANVHINGQLIAAPFDVTPHLTDANRIEIHFPPAAGAPPPSAGGAFPCAVCLVIAAR